MSNQRNNRRNNQRPRRRDNALLPEEKRQTELLRQIKDFSSTQTRGDTPTVPDVPYPVLKRRKIYTFERTNQIGSITVQGSTPIDLFGAYEVTLASFPDSAEFTALFDQYRIAALEFTFVPVTSNGTGSPLYTVIDYDDSSPLTLVGQVLEYDTLQITQPGQFHKRSLIPQVSTTVYNTAITSGYSSKSMQWIDAGNPNVPHYGLKYAAPFIAGVNYQITVLVKAIIQCKDIR